MPQIRSIEKNVYKVNAAYYVGDGFAVPKTNIAGGETPPLREIQDFI